MDGRVRAWLLKCLVTVALAGCAASSTGSPAPSQLSLTTVTDALRASGIAVVQVTDNLDPRDGAWRCIPGSFRLARVLQQAPAPVARPGDRPSVDVLLFTSDADRSAAQAAITPDGQVQAAGCAAMVDWIAPPHVVGARNVLLFVATGDAATVDALRAAASRLGA
jgi:hypothetical protein